MPAAPALGPAHELEEEPPLVGHHRRRGLAEMARAEGRLGLDTEFMPEGRYRPLLCLVQIVVGEHVEVLDPLTATFDPAPLAAVLADPDIEIVLHAGRQDVALPGTHARLDALEARVKGKEAVDAAR